MTVRQILKTVNVPRHTVTATGSFGPGPWLRSTTIPTSAMLAGTRFQAVVHGRVGNLQYGAGHHVTLELQVRWSGLPPSQTSPAWFHVITLNESGAGAPLGETCLPFYMLASADTSAPLEVWVRLNIIQTTGNPPWSVGVDIEDLTITVFALDELDASGIPYALSANTLNPPVVMSTDPAVPTPVANGPAIPGGTGRYAFFWSASVEPREFGPAPSYLPPFPPDQYWLFTALRQAASGAIRKSWGRRGYARRAGQWPAPAPAPTRVQIGGSWVTDWSVASDVPSVWAAETTSLGPNNAWGGASVHDVQFFAIRVEDLGLQLVETSNTTRIFYGRPSSASSQGLIDGDPLRLIWEGDQARHRAAFFDGVPQLIGLNTQMSFTTRIEQFARSNGLGSNRDVPLHTLQLDSQEHTWDVETTETTQIPGQNNFDAVGEWSFWREPTIASVTGAHGRLRYGQFWSILTQTGVVPPAVNSPQPGPPIYIVPEREAPQVHTLRELPVPPMRSEPIEASLEQTVLRALDGTIKSWPTVMRPGRVREFEWIISTSTTEGLEQFDAVRKFFDSGDRAAFQFMPMKTSTAYPYVIDASSLRGPDSVDAKVFRFSFRALELRWVEL